MLSDATTLRLSESATLRTVLVSLHYLTMHVFHKSSRLAGLLVLPSLGWICSTVTLITLFARQQRKVLHSSLSLSFPPFFCVYLQCMHRCFS